MHNRLGPIGVRERDRKIIAVLENGEASTQRVCEAIGLKFPAQLEMARAALLRLQRAGVVIKSVRPNHQTRIAYFSLARTNDINRQNAERDAEGPQNANAKQNTSPVPGC